MCRMQTAGYRAIPVVRSTAAVLLAGLLLGCGGATGSAENSATSPASPPPLVPTVSLSAAPATVAAGGSSMLTWSSPNAASCVASGAWSGNKAASGTQSTGALTATSTYTLTCSNSSGSASRSVTVVVGSIGLSGTVDSSLVNRWAQQANVVHVFSGFDTTAGTPVATAPVVQDTGACTFRYGVGQLADGDYTVAFSRDGGASFPRAENVTVSGGVAMRDITAARVVRVGPARQFTRPSQAVAVVQDGDVVEIDAGVYDNDAASWNQNNITLRGIGGYAHLRITNGTNAQGKGTWVIGGSNVTVENIEFSGAQVVDLNGAGIRADGSNLTVCNGYFHDNQQGILGGAGDVLIEYSEFARNGNCLDPNGCAHNMYIAGSTNRFMLRHSYSHHANQGHTVKSRARENYILYNRIMDEASGNSSYTVDLPNGGLSFIIGNLLQQGPNTENSTIVTYGAEGLSNPSRTLYVVNNTLVNDRGAGGIFIDIASGATATVQNNLFVGNGTPISGSATQVTNRTTNTPNFVDSANFDYRPTAATPGLNAGTSPGIASGFDLNPVYQYAHPANRAPRPSDGAIDIGAYEYVP